MPRSRSIPFETRSTITTTGMTLADAAFVASVRGAGGVMKSYAEYLALLGDQREASLCAREGSLLAGALLYGGVPDVR